MMPYKKNRWQTLERREMAIFPVALLMYAYTSQLKSFVGVNHKHFIMSYQGWCLACQEGRR